MIMHQMGQSYIGNNPGRTMGKVPRETNVEGRSTQSTVLLWQLPHNGLQSFGAYHGK